MTTHTFEPVELPSRYAKAIVAIITAALAVVLTATADDTFTTAEIVGVIVAIVAAIGVYLVPNVPAGPGRYLKMLVAIIGAAGQAAIPLVTEGSITTSGFILIALAALGAVGVGIVPNTPAVPVVEVNAPLVDGDQPI